MKLIDEVRRSGQSSNLSTEEGDQNNQNALTEELNEYIQAEKEELEYDIASFDEIVF